VFVMASTAGAVASEHGHAAWGAGDPCSLQPGGGLVRLEKGDIRYSYVIAADNPAGCTGSIRAAIFRQRLSGTPLP
jgi:hypothetical protein